MRQCSTVQMQLQGPERPKHMVDRKLYTQYVFRHRKESASTVTVALYMQQHSSNSCRDKRCRTQEENEDTDRRFSAQTVLNTGRKCSTETEGAGQREGAAQKQKVLHRKRSRQTEGAKLRICQSDTKGTEASGHEDRLVVLKLKQQMKHFGQTVKFSKRVEDKQNEIFNKLDE